jgi:hypothetical protein
VPKVTKKFLTVSSGKSIRISPGIVSACGVMDRAIESRRGIGRKFLIKKYQKQYALNDLKISCPK